MTRRLLIRPGGIGDCILSLPALEAARADYTEVWVPSSVVPLIQFADRVQAISRTGLELVGIPGAETGAVFDRLAEFDSIYSWYGTRRPEFREAVRGFPFRFFPALPAGQQHAADFFAAHTGAAIPAFPRLTFKVPKPAAEYVAIHPFSGGVSKNWPLEHFVTVSVALRQRGLETIWCVSPEQSLPSGLPVEQHPSLDSLAARLAGARLYIGNDSGVTHLAAACGTATVAVFLRTEPGIWAPRGPLVSLVRQPDGAPPPADRVLAAALSLLAQSLP